MITLLIIGWIVFASYCAYIVIVYGIKKSVSVTVYELPQNQQWIFTVVLMILSFCSLIGSAMAGYYFFAAASFLITLIAVGVHYSKREGWTTPTKFSLPGHLIGSFGCVLIGTAAVYLDLGYIYLSIASLIILAVLQKWGGPFKTTYQEWFAVTFYLGLIIYSLL